MSVTITKLMKISLVMILYCIPVISIPLALAVAIELIGKENEESGIWRSFWITSKRWLTHSKRILLLTWLLIIAWLLLMQLQASLSWYYKLFMTSFYLNIIHNLLQLEARSTLPITTKVRLSISLFIRYLPREFIIMSLLLLVIYFGLNNFIITIFILPTATLWVLHISQKDIWQSLEEELQEQKKA